MRLKLSRNTFDLPVKIKVSGEQGVITGYSQHKRSKGPQFYVEYKAADGRATDAWFFEDQLEIAVTA